LNQFFSPIAKLEMPRSNRKPDAPEAPDLEPSEANLLAPATDTKRSGSLSSAFRRERQMLAPLLEALPRLLGDRDGREVTLLVEPSAGGVIPDLVMGVWHPTAPAHSLVGLSYIEAHLLCEIARHSSVTRTELFTRVHVTDAGAARAIDRLTRAGVVSADTDSIYATVALSLDVEIVAFELKLQRWKDALRQAVEYRTFANRSFVVLDGARLSLTSGIRAAFRTAGVGLLVQDAHALRKVISAPHVDPATAERVLLVQKLHRTQRSNCRTDAS
jgi:hypothetical protein